MAELFRANPSVHTSSTVVTKLAADVAQNDTSFSVVPGVGALLPSPSNGDYFHLRIGSNLLNEVARVTARSGDTMVCDPLENAWLAETDVVWTVSAETLEGFQPPFVAFYTVLAGVSANGAPALVGSLRLPAGRYAPPSAILGCAHPADTAILHARLQDGTVIGSVGGLPGGLQWRQALEGFTLAAATAIDLVLSASTSNAVALTRGFQVDRIT